MGRPTEDCGHERDGYPDVDTGGLPLDGRSHGADRADIVPCRLLGAHRRAAGAVEGIEEDGCIGAAGLGPRPSRRGRPHQAAGGAREAVRGLRLPSSDRGSDVVLVPVRPFGLFVRRGDLHDAPRQEARLRGARPGGRHRVFEAVPLRPLADGRPRGRRDRGAAGRPRVPLRRSPSGPRRYGTLPSNTSSTTSDRSFRFSSELAARTGLGPSNETSPPIPV